MLAASVIDRANALNAARRRVWQELHGAIRSSVRCEKCALWLGGNSVDHSGSTRTPSSSTLMSLLASLYYYERDGNDDISGIGG